MHFPKLYIYIYTLFEKKSLDVICQVGEAPVHNIFTWAQIQTTIHRSVLYPARVIAHPKKMKTISADVSWTVGGPPSYYSGSEIQK